MGEHGFSFSPISRHFLSFLLFLDTFSLILDTKVSRNGNEGKSVTNAGPEQPFRCLDTSLFKNCSFAFCSKLSQTPAVEVDEGGDGDKPIEDDLVPVVAPHQVHL